MALRKMIGSLIGMFSFEDIRAQSWGFILLILNIKIKLNVVVQISLALNIAETFLDIIL